MSEIDISRLIKDITENTEKNSGVRTVFGEPVKVDNRTIIPVACVTISGGAGGGLGRSEQAKPGAAKDKNKKTEEKGWGGGGGWHVESRPVGYIEISGGGVQFKKIEDVTKIALRALMIPIVVVALAGLAGIIRSFQHGGVDKSA